MSFVLLLALATQHPAAALANAVDLPDARSRREVAAKLAARPDVTLAQWLSICASFGTFEPAEPGTRKETVTLRIGERDEPTPIHYLVPQGYDPAKPAPLLLAAHGTGGTGQGLPGTWYDAAQKLGMIVIAPNETGANDGYAFSERERQVARAAVRWARRRFCIDADRVFLSGISRGGHLAWDVGLRWPDQFAALAVFIGGPRINLYQGQNNLRWIENLAPVPIRDLQGEQDDPKLLFNVRLAFEKLQAFGARDARLVTFPDLGHSYRPNAVDWNQWLGGARRDPVPARVVRVATRLDEARAFWAEITEFEAGVDDDPKLRLTASENAKFEKLDDFGKLAQAQKVAEQQVARLEVEQKAPGVFVAKTTRVKAFRLLLTSAMCDPKQRVEVTVNGRPCHKTVQPNAQVLLREFVERFDRTFLPVAEVRVP